MGLESNLSKPCRLGRTFLVNPRDTWLMILMSRKSKYIAQVGRFLGPPERTYKRKPRPGNSLLLVLLGMGRFEHVS